MSLIFDTSVIVIGAGASVPFGAPDGLKLLDEIEKTLVTWIQQLSPLSQIHGSMVSQSLARVVPSYYAWHKYGFDKAVLAKDALAEIQTLVDFLSRQTSDSVDDVIRQNPSYANVLKTCVAFELLKVTHWADQQGNYIIRDLDVRILNDARSSQRNWIHRLINVARTALLNPQATWYAEKPKIRIVSFNYDGILEHVLKKKWNDVEGEFGDWRDIFEIMHPHGVIPVLPQIQLSELPRYLAQAASQIAVVHDSSVTEEIKFARDTASSTCQNAFRIYAMGFAFAPSNCTLLGWDKPICIDIDNHGNVRGEETRHIHYINYGGSDGLKRRVESTFLKSPFDNDDSEITWAEIEFHPSEPSLKGGSIEITDALLNGFLGEMPS